MKYIVFCDFDGTITLQDTCVELTKRYARGEFEEIERMWAEGRHDARVLSQKLLDMIEIDEEEMESFASGIDIDPYFKKFVDLMDENGIRIYIVSDGYDNIIEPILRKNGLSRLEYHANSIVFENGKLKGEFPNNDSGCGSCGSCKIKVIESLEEEGVTKIYIGDGHSDRCATQNGDIVFAKGDLADILTERGEEFVPFDDFSDIISYMKSKILQK